MEQVAAEHALAEVEEEEEKEEEEEEGFLDQLQRVWTGRPSDGSLAESLEPITRAWRYVRSLSGARRAPGGGAVVAAATDGEHIPAGRRRRRHWLGSALGRLLERQTQRPYLDQILLLSVLVGCVLVLGIVVVLQVYLRRLGLTLSVEGLAVLWLRWLDGGIGAMLPEFQNNFTLAGKCDRPTHQGAVPSSDAPML
jgi:hypothetical protein